MPKQKYHINPKTGEPGICVAKISCRFGGPGDHYPSELDARYAFERIMAREASLFVVAKGEVSALPPNTIYTNANGLQATQVKPGKYFIGDPYVVIGAYDQGGWNAFVEQVEQDMGWENEVEQAALESTPLVGATYDGCPLVAVKAFHGSGLHWSVAPPRRLAADAGLVSPIPMEILNRLGIDPTLARVKRMGFTHSFDAPTELYRDRNGNIHFEKSLLIAHNDALPDEAWESLDSGDLQDTIYELEERRFKTYQRVVAEHNARTSEY